MASGLARADDSSFSFVVVGDTQTDGSHSSINWDVLPDLVDSMNRTAPDFAIFVGDLVGGSSYLSSTITQWQDFDAVTSNLSCDRYMVPGNHDMYAGVATFDAWVEMWPFLPTENSPEGEEGMTYYFDYGNTRFISVRTDDPLYRRVRDIPLVPQRDILHRRGNGAAADAGETGQVFRQHGIAFVRHCRRPLLAR